MGLSNHPVQGETTGERENTLAELPLSSHLLPTSGRRHAARREDNLTMFNKSEGSFTHRDAAAHVGRGACRNLFGSVDHDELNRELKLRLKEMAEQDTRRWNFHFETDTPLPGAYKWEEMPLHRAASPYREATRAGAEAEDGRTPGERRCLRSVDDKADSSGVSHTASVPAEVTPVRGKRVVSKRAPNYKVTDFFVKRRKMSEAKTIPTHFHPSYAQQTLSRRI